ncbi:hypothetical protein OAQ34_05330 [Opitutales bacterium]|nr:hypothetical protein [Opitutales bacterium]
MKKLTNRKKGVMFAAMTDLFMNFALALVWVLFVMPTNGSSLPEEQIEPDQAEGSTPANGRTIARISMSLSTGQSIVHYQGKEMDFTKFKKLKKEDQIPDHVVFSFSDTLQFNDVIRYVLENDCGVSLILKNRE